MMFRAILETQWKWSRSALLLATLAAFAIPLFSVRQGATAFAYYNAVDILNHMRSAGPSYAVAAAAIGLAVALCTWAPDHAGRHVYALSLPIDRWRYVAMRFAAGGMMLLIPAIALWIGAIAAIAMVTVPEPLEVYPTSLAIRFGLATLLAYAMFFAVSSATKRTAGIILAGLAAIVLAEVALSQFIGYPLGATLRVLLDMLTYDAGVLNVFTGRWMLIDV